MKRFLLALALLMGLGLLVTSCEKEGTQDSLIGTWEGTMQTQIFKEIVNIDCRFVFTDKFVTITMNGKTDSPVMYFYDKSAKILQISDVTLGTCEVLEFTQSKLVFKMKNLKDATPITLHKVK